MWLFDYIGLDLGYTVVGLAGFSFVLIILWLISSFRISKLNKKYKRFMGGQDAKTLEEQFMHRFNELDVLQSVSKDHKERLDKIQENLLLTYQKVGIVKYDAFKEMGGKLSFALALLNGENDGYVLNSMHSSREGCYTYVKEIIKGEAYVMLSEEEKLALAEAIKHGSLID
jgi:hypothetical protein